MPPLPIVSGRDCVRALEAFGYTVVRQKGSHVRMACEGRTPVTIPMHATLKPGTLRAIIRTVGVTVEAFLAELD